MGKRKVQIVQADAFDFISKLKSSSVDLIVSSPPYFMGKEYDTSMSVSDFVDAHRQLLPELVRILRSGGSIAWQVGHHIRNGVLTPLDALVFSCFSTSDELKLRNRIVWTFGHGVHARKRFSGRHESILWFTKGAEYFFNLNAVRVAQKYPGKKHYKGANKGSWSGNPNGKNPSDVWDIPNVKAGHIERAGHPCQFPVALVQRLIRSLCPAGGLVVDPFSGSGTTAVAAALEGRGFRGCDINEKYVSIANDRLAAFRAGSLKYRSDKPVYRPEPTMTVAIRPPHFKVHTGEPQ